MYAVDLFCGAGGFSEGIIQAGFHIVYSSDISEHVMVTYKNRHDQLGLKQDYNTHFELGDIRTLTGENILTAVNNLEFFKTRPINEIDAVFGGPPCQGFSRAGRRDKNDPRNMLFKQYVRVISELNPKYVVMENVEGFMDTRLDDFEGLSGKIYPKDKLVSEILQEELDQIGYQVLPPKVLDASDFGVPQRRLRAIFMAYRKDVQAPKYPSPTTGEKESKVKIWEAIGDLITDHNKQIENQDVASSEYIHSSRIGRTPHFDTGNTIPVNGELTNCDLSKHSKSVQQRFSLYRAGETTKHVVKKIQEYGLILDSDEYKHLLWECAFNANKEDNKKLLDKILHEVKPEINVVNQTREKLIDSILTKVVIVFMKELDLKDKDRNGRKKVDNNFLKEKNLTKEEFEMIFQQFVEKCNRKYPIEYIIKVFAEKAEDDTLFEYLLTKKNTRCRLDRNSVSPTMLTLPDDFISPFEDRILTVREMARLQSFDDSFEFKGKRTTGGDKRKAEVPQYTQVGNAVPPLLAKAIALEIALALQANATTEEFQLEIQL